MVSEIPKNVFSFLYLMWGGVWCKYVTFLTPNILKKSKENIEKLTRDCEAIVWIISNPNADYSGVVAKGYTNENVLNFAFSSAAIYLHENIFELCGVEFGENLLPKDFDKENVLRFYVDYPPNIVIVRHLYSSYVNEQGSTFELNKVKPHLVELVKNKKSEILDSLESISHFDALDYAIALKDYENPQRAQAFIIALKRSLIAETSEKLRG